MEQAYYFRVAMILSILKEDIRDTVAVNTPGPSANRANSRRPAGRKNWSLRPFQRRRKPFGILWRIFCAGQATKGESGKHVFADGFWMTTKTRDDSRGHYGLAVAVALAAPAIDEFGFAR